VIVCGLLEQPVVHDGLAIGPGAIAVWLTFVGGQQPAFTRVEIRGLVDGSRAVVTCEAGGPVGLPGLLDGLIDALADVSVEAEATPLGDVFLSFASGLEIAIPASHPLRVSGATEGPADAPCLSRPLEVGIGGTGLRVSHRHLRWLASQVPVAIATARLHPDGRVELEGSGGRLARLVQGGLGVASEQLSDLVRTAPAFERVRTFLRP
jgi:hypothetical protein